MKIAILSGKGGTGKTFISTNLAHTAAELLDGDLYYIDCDVEAPNGKFFLHNNIQKSESEVEKKDWRSEHSDSSTEDVFVRIPSFDAERCIGCRACVDACAFGALAFIMDKPLLFEGICHSCGGCLRACRTGAITEIDKPVGTITSDRLNNLHLIEGRMNVGETSGMPVIEGLLGKTGEKDIAFLDCPPGTACSAAACVKAADFCFIVAEPSVFGSHNLAMAYNLVTFFHKPVAVILNKVETGTNHSEDFCLEHHVPIALKVSFTPERARAISEGQLLSQVDDEFHAQCVHLLENLSVCLGKEAFLF